MEWPHGIYRWGAMIAIVLRDFYYNHLLMNLCCITDRSSKSFVKIKIRFFFTKKALVKRLIRPICRVYQGHLELHISRKTSILFVWDIYRYCSFSTVIVYCSSRDCIVCMSIWLSRSLWWTSAFTHIFIHTYTLWQLASVINVLSNKITRNKNCLKRW